MTPMTFVTRRDDVIWRGKNVIIAKWRPSWIRHIILDFWIPPQLQESNEIERKAIKAIKETPICPKNTKVIVRKVSFLHFKKRIFLFMKN